ncbi:MAG TPA: MBG domain-containing protein, partial [Tepidisphaeraceae bacterium]|nr:MBG domain-containing protein [Tepidisphaeraceae bacterium]
SGLVNGDSVSAVSLSSAGAAAGATVVAPGPTYAITASNAQGSGLGNYTIGYNSGTLTVTPAPLTVTALGGTSTYGQSPGNPGLSASGLQNGESVSVLTGLSNGFGITNLTNAGNYTTSVLGTLTNGNYTMGSSNPGSWVVNPAALTYVANPASSNFGSAFPAFTGTVTGFVNGETMASATTGTLAWNTTVTPTSPQGFYPIDGSGLTANFGNYVFVQAASNTTALALGIALSPPYTPPNQSNNPPASPVNISFQNPNTGNFIHVSFTPNSSNTANNQNNQNNNVNPASLPPGDQFTHNNGFDFTPISQYDENQYSDFKLPDYASDDSEAAILTILARGASPGHGQDYMIDNFWNGTDATWPGAGNIKLTGKLIFSDGAGHDVTPTNDAAFPIVAGKTDFAALLKNGPVMIGGPPSQTPAQWLLATAMTPDGKDIVCDDPATGGMVELGYDPATETVGGITGVFNPKTNGFVALTDAGSDIPTNDASGLAGLQSFVPSTYYAVTVH